MAQTIILASGSSIRAQLMTNANVNYDVVLPAIDEQSVKADLLSRDLDPEDVVAALAFAKAQDVSARTPGALVIGCDQILTFDGALFSKPLDQADALDQLQTLSGQTHRLISAAVICENGKVRWQHQGHVQLQMRDLSKGYLTDYVARNWDSVRHTVGCYKLEEEGVRLFTSIQGDYFHVLGMPLLEILDFLTQRGELAT